jgi:hypothetical protein
MKIGHPSASLRNGPSGPLLDRQIWGSPASASTGAVSSMEVPLDADFPPARSISPEIHPRVESFTPAPSILKNTATPIHPSRLRPTVTTENQAFSSIIYQQALDTLLPATPVYHTQFEMAASISARSVPKLNLNDSISARITRPIPVSLATVNCLAQIKFTEEPMTPNRHHYTGRPLQCIKAIVHLSILSTFNLAQGSPIPLHCSQASLHIQNMCGLTSISSLAPFIITLSCILVAVEAPRAGVSLVP